MIKGRYKIIGSKNGQQVSDSGWINNHVPFSDGVGINLLIRALGNNSTYPPAITKAKMGTGTTAPDDTDTDLETPTVDDILIATRNIGIDELELKFFASDAQVPDDTYTEFGIFAVEQLFARSIITPSYVKSSGVDTTIIYNIQITNT